MELTQKQMHLNAVKWLGTALLSLVVIWVLVSNLAYAGYLIVFLLGCLVGSVADFKSGLPKLPKPKPRQRTAVAPVEPVSDTGFDYDGLVDPNESDDGWGAVYTTSM